MERGGRFIEDFLQRLRAQDPGAGVQVHLTVRRVVAAYDGDDPEELCQVLCALLGGDRAGAARVRALFQECLDEWRRQPEQVAAPNRRRWLSLWLIMLVGLVIAVLSNPCPLDRVSPPDLGMPDGGPISPPDLGAADLGGDESEAGDGGVTALPSLPELPREHGQAALIAGAKYAGIAGGAWILLLCGLYLWYSRERPAPSRKRRSRRKLDQKQSSGAQRFQLLPRRLRPAVPAEDLDEFAALLGRISRQVAGRELDVERTLDRLGREGLLGALIMHRRRGGQQIIVLRDLGRETQVFQRKVEALLQGLRLRWETISVWYFDGDTTHVWNEDGQLLGGADFCQEHQDAALIVVSAGGALLTNGRRVRRWVAELRAFERRTWLHPLADPRSWQPEMMGPDFPFRVWPMTRQGFRGAASDLSAPEWRIQWRREELLPARRVTGDDVERVRRLVAVVPYAHRDLAEWQRQRFCEDIPADVLWDLVRGGTDQGGAVLRWPLSELAMLLDELRAPGGAGPSEQEVRQALLDGPMRDSKPPAGTMAHLRWELARAEQQIHLPDQREEALETLRRLMGPLYEEVQELLSRLRTLALIPPLRDEEYALLEDAARQEEAAAAAAGEGPEEPALGAAETLLRRWIVTWEVAWPGLLRLAIVVAVVLGISYLIGVSVTYRRGYGLRWEGGTLKVDRLPDQPAAPGWVDLYHGGEREPVIRGLELDQRGQAGIDVPAGARSEVYFVLGGSYRSDGVVVPAAGVAAKGHLLVRFVSRGGRVGGIEFELQDATGRTSEGRADQWLDVRPGSYEISGKGQRNFKSFQERVAVAAGERKELGPIELRIAAARVAVRPPSPGPASPPISPVPPGAVAPTRPPGQTKPDQTEPVLKMPPVPGRMVWIDADHKHRMDRTPVTGAAYKRCVDANVCNPPRMRDGCIWDRGDLARAQNCVTAADAETYCKFVKRHLPSWKEWELAVRAQSGTEYRVPREWTASDDCGGDAECNRRKLGSVAVEDGKPMAIPWAALQDEQGPRIGFRCAVNLE